MFVEEQQSAPEVSEHSYDVSVILTLWLMTVLYFKGVLICMAHNPY